jgi:hypothetical protein
LSVDYSISLSRWIVPDNVPLVSGTLKATRGFETTEKIIRKLLILLSIRRRKVGSVLSKMTVQLSIINKPLCFQCHEESDLTPQKGVKLTTVRVNMEV